MVQNTPTRRNRTASKGRGYQGKKSGFRAPAAKAASTPKVVNPANLYAMPDFPVQGREMELFAVNARVGIVLTPDSVEERIFRNNEGELFTSFLVSGVTDRGDSIWFTAETVPGLEDEIRLTSTPEFGATAAERAAFSVLDSIFQAPGSNFTI